ncbi:hypothetical protein BDZ45DRAFT_801082 [Acephala macrosclerotiorum]|nr:hypothetical protein BDZ45DRAFT_801082 [Acephala macrosclerotiorum]
MVTLATHAACSAFLSSSSRLAEVIDFQLEGNISSDKKLSWESVHEPRGVSVLAWGTITDEASQKILGCSTKRLKTVLEEWKSRTMPQHIKRCRSHAHGMWTRRDLTLSLYFPSLLAGTVGGGTGYATQREALELIRRYAEGKKWALAETIAAFALSLEVSTLAAMTNDTFAES